MGSDSAPDRIAAMRGLLADDPDLAEVLSGREMRRNSRTGSLQRTLQVRKVATPIEQQRTYLLRHDCGLEPVPDIDIYPQDSHILAWDLRRPGSCPLAVVLAELCQCRYRHAMSTMNISLPETLKSFMDDQFSARGYSTSSEYVRELIRKDQDRQRLRGLLLEGRHRRRRSRPMRTTSTGFVVGSATPAGGERQAGCPARAGAARCRRGNRALSGRGGLGGCAGLHRRD